MDFALTPALWVVIVILLLIIILQSELLWNMLGLILALISGILLFPILLVAAFFLSPYLAYKLWQDAKKSKDYTKEN